MKYRSIAHPQWAAFEGSIFCGSEVVAFACFQSWKSFASLIISFFVVSAIVCTVRLSPAFSYFEMDHSGIRNRKIKFSWNEIQDISLHTAETYIFRGVGKITFPSFVSIGTKKSMIKSNFFRPSWSFLSQSQYVFISMYPKHLEALNQYGRGKSPVVDEFLSLYYAPQVNHKTSEGTNPQRK